MMLAGDLPFVHTRDGEIEGTGYTYAKENDAAAPSPAIVWKIRNSAGPASLISSGNWTNTVPNTPLD